MVKIFHQSHFFISLTPSLPQGVHLKVVECYVSIFEHIKGKRLARDLPLWCGLFSLFPFASIQTKPELLRVFEEYFIPLELHLKPCLSIMILSLLSGLEEEEGTKIFLESNGILIKLLNIMGDELFFRSLWDNILVSSHCRVSGYKFISHHLQKSKIVLYQPLVIESICSSLRDNTHVTKVCVGYSL
jgi:hypothetical protein